MVLGNRVQGLGLRVQGLGVRVEGLGCRVLFMVAQALILASWQGEGAADVPRLQRSELGKIRDRSTLKRILIPKSPIPLH